MSDGNHATPDAAPGGPRAPQVDDDVRLTGMGPRSRGAAPWERFETSARGPAVGVVAHRLSSQPRPAPPPEAAIDEDSGSNGCHTDGGLSVADLIAKVGGPATNRPSHHHAAPDFAPSDSAPYELDDPFDTYAAATPAAYNSSLPGPKFNCPAPPQTA
ncbi:MAG: hypothetical protein J2P17_16055, partial [Mycobacterium sp.]|nr:hypothetical protein [Mycobacterium sp.]